MSEPGVRRGLLAIAGLAGALAVVHLAGAGARHESRLAATRASEAFIAAEARQVRETVLTAMGNNPGLDKDVRAAELGEALQLRHGAMGGAIQASRNGEGIDALSTRATSLRARSEALALDDTEFELAEAALQLAILLLAVAMATGTGRSLQRAALALAGLGTLLALVAGADLLIG